jgi:hypothetical protein
MVGVVCVFGVVWCGAVPEGVYVLFVVWRLMYSLRLIYCDARVTGTVSAL